MIRTFYHFIFILLFIYTTFIKRFIHNQTCSNALIVLSKQKKNTDKHDTHMVWY